MGYFRFRRSFKLLPGMRMNLSKSGVSTSIGRRGLWFTIGPRGTRETVGIPGTGISYTEQQSAGATNARDDLQTPADSAGLTIGRALLWLTVVGVAVIILVLALA